LKSDQLIKPPDSAQVATDRHDLGIGSLSEAIDPPSVSRSVVSPWAEQIRPLLLDPAIIAEPAVSFPEAVSHTVEISKVLLQRADSNLDPDKQENSGPSLYQPQVQTNSEIENLNRFTARGKVAASIPGSINDISQIHATLDTDFLSRSNRPGASAAADVWNQSDLTRFTGVQGNLADLTDAEASLPDPARAPGREPVPAANRPERGLANVSLLLAGLQNESPGQGQDEGQGGILSSPGALFPWADGGADGLFAATVSPSIPRVGPFEMGREFDAVAGDLRGTPSPMPQTRTEDTDQPRQSQSGQDAEESESLGDLASRLAAVAERLEQAALRLASQAPPLAAAPRPFQGRVGA
jgi:hypothetical protein